LNLILKGREERVKKRINFMKVNKANSYLCLTINMPGYNKTNNFSKKVFGDAQKVIKKELNQKNVNIIANKTFRNKAGSVFLLATNLITNELKKIAIDIEENYIAGRLLDIDIYNNENIAIDRDELGYPPRKCFICGQNAKICMVKNSHTNKELESYLDDLRSKFETYLNKKIKKTAKLVEVLAYESIIREVLTSPKPGLVDLMDSGSHDDMNLDTFLRSSNAIKPFFSKFFIKGAKNFDKKNKFELLRSLGTKTEEKMFAATNGVNTQKGIIFSFALVIAALGELFIKYDCTNFDNISVAISKIIKKWTFGLVESELRIKVEKTINDNKKFTSVKKLTHGQICYLSYGITGARGEAESGFENVLNYGLPVLKRYKRQEYSNNFASIQTLISLISEVDDTNIIYRSDIDTLKYIKNQFKELKKQNGILTFEGNKKYEKLNKFMKSNSISPGGSADLLATTHLFYKIEKNLEQIIYM